MSDRVKNSALEKLSERGYKPQILNFCWDLIKDTPDPIQRLSQWLTEHAEDLTPYRMGLEQSSTDVTKAVVGDMQQMVLAIVQRRAGELAAALICSVAREFLSLLSHWQETELIPSIVGVAGKLFEAYVTAIFVVFVPSRSREKDSLTLHDKLLILGPRVESDPRFRMKVADLNELRTSRNRSLHDVKVIVSDNELRTELSSMLLKLKQFVIYGEAILDEGVPSALVSMSTATDVVAKKAKRVVLKEAKGSVKQYNSQKQYGHLIVDPTLCIRAGIRIDSDIYFHLTHVATADKHKIRRNVPITCDIIESSRHAAGAQFEARNIKLADYDLDAFAAGPVLESNLKVLPVFQSQADRVADLQAQSSFQQQQHFATQGHDQETLWRQKQYESQRQQELRAQTVPSTSEGIISWEALPEKQPLPVYQMTTPLPSSTGSFMQTPPVVQAKTEPSPVPFGITGSAVTRVPLQLGAPAFVPPSQQFQPQSFQFQPQQFQPQSQQFQTQQPQPQLFSQSAQFVVQPQTFPGVHQLQPQCLVTPLSSTVPFQRQGLQAPMLQSQQHFFPTPQVAPQFQGGKPSVGFGRPYIPPDSGPQKMS